MKLTNLLLNVGRWLGNEPNALVNGRVDVRLGSAVSGLTGIQSITSGRTVLTGSGLPIVFQIGSLVDINKSILLSSYIINETNEFFTSRLSSSTEITATRRQGTSDITMYWIVLEFY